jgi:hypothetical protein
VECPACSEDLRDGAIRCPYCDAAVGPDPISTGEAEEVFRSRHFVLARTSSGHVLYDTQRPGFPLRNFGSQEGATDAAMFELGRMERFLSPRWTMPLLVAFCLAAGFWLAGLGFAIFYDEPPTLGQPEPGLNIPRFFMNNHYLAFQASILIAALGGLLYVRSRLGRMER